MTSSQVLHLFPPSTSKHRAHVFHCYELLLLQTLDSDAALWADLQEAFGHCQECLNEETGEHKSDLALTKFARHSIPKHLWFLAVVLQESRDKLVFFIRSEMKKSSCSSALALSPPPPPLLSPNTSSLLSSYLSAFNFVELHLDNILGQGNRGVDVVFRPPPAAAHGEEERGAPAPLTDSEDGQKSQVPLEIFRCPNVRTLSLKSNFLERIPPDIGRLKKLSKLSLTNNKLGNHSIPFTLAFCTSLSELYLDHNLLDALPEFLLRMPSLRTVHRHGNHNYFKATFMWYHTDINHRILYAEGSGGGGAADASATDSAAAARPASPDSLQRLCATRIITSRADFFAAAALPPRLKDYVADMCAQLNVCGNCPTAKPQTQSGYKVFTFKNPYLGNTCVPFLHWACSMSCAEDIDIPARMEQINSAQEQDRIYQRKVAESISALRHGMSLAAPAGPSSACSGGGGGVSAAAAAGAQATVVVSTSQRPPRLCSIEAAAAAAAPTSALLRLPPAATPAPTSAAEHGEATRLAATAYSSDGDAAPTAAAGIGYACGIL